MLPTRLFPWTTRFSPFRRRTASWKTKITQLKNFHEFREYERIHIYDPIVSPSRKFESSGESSLSSFSPRSNCRLLLARSDNDDNDGGKTWRISVRFFCVIESPDKPKLEKNIAPRNGFATGMQGFRPIAVFRS